MTPAGSSRSLPDGSVAQTVTGPDGVRTIIVRKARTFTPGQVDPSSVVAPFAVYVPHTVRHPEILATAPANAIWVDVTQSDIAYYAALHDWWAAGETFMVLEHDVLCRPDIIEQLARCSSPWCAFPYTPFCHRECWDAWGNMLGCTRFTAELIAQVPDAVSSIPREGWGWQNVCDGLGQNLRRAGFTHHWHEPAVAHRGTAVGSLQDPAND